MSIIKLAKIKYNNIVIKEIVKGMKKNDPKYLEKRYKEIKQQIVGASPQSQRYRNGKEGLK